MASPQWFNTDWIGRLKWHSLLQYIWEIDYFCLVLGKSWDLCWLSTVLQFTSKKACIYWKKYTHGNHWYIKKFFPPTNNPLKISCPMPWSLRLENCVRTPAIVSRNVHIDGDHGDDANGDWNKRWWRGRCFCLVAIWCKLLKISNIISWHW